MFLGWLLVDDHVTKEPVAISRPFRTQHVVIVGKSGFGKSTEIGSAMSQDVGAGRGFLTLDHHGDNTPRIFRAVAREEQRVGEDLSSKLIIIDPTDPEYSPGFNPLEGPTEHRFRQASEIAVLLKNRFDLTSLGARTEELVRNVIHLAADAGLTLVDIAQILTDEAFREAALRQVTNEEVRSYFIERYARASEQFQATIREPVLNKLSAFVGNPAFRHVLGQRHSTFSLLEAMDRGYWVAIPANLGKLGPEAATFTGLILTWLRTAFFRRNQRTLFTIYADEVQNLLVHAQALESLLSESRKFSIGVVTANQFLEQHPPEVRAALLSAGSFVLFRLSAPDAEKFATYFDGGKRLAELLKNLPQRHVVVKTGDQHWQQAVIPRIEDPEIDYSDLYRRCRLRWMRPRAQIEAEIRERHQRAAHSREEFNDWE